ncbi:group III truncated hemoglobin, partial [Caldibacillus thermoamylovorans]|uniref:group III truncated hemoglobin n=1 Tax=Caldibacillus thermoamylovorans TaxID=35841 RepID=UPI00203AFFA1
MDAILRQNPAGVLLVTRAAAPSLPRSTGHFRHDCPARLARIRTGPPPRRRADRRQHPRSRLRAFYDRVRADPLLGPVFDAKLAGRWDDHLPKMVTFWSSLVLGTKGYRGNVQQAHQPLDGIEPAHF